MRRFFYYTTPFVLIPAFMLLWEYLDNTTPFRISPYFCIIALPIISLIMGTLSQTHHKFDYMMTAMMPLSCFCFMFIVGFFSEGEFGPTFDLYRAFKTAFQPLCFIAYCCMALSAFLSSYKRIRMKIAKSTQYH